MEERLTLAAGFLRTRILTGELIEYKTFAMHIGLVELHGRWWWKPTRNLLDFISAEDIRTGLPIVDVDRCIQDFRHTGSRLFRSDRVAG